MKNLITYLKTMNVEDKMNTMLDMLARDGSPSHVHMINYFTKYINEIFKYAIIKSDAKPSSIEELTISHLHSYLGMRGYIKGIGAMSAEERMAANEKGYENGIGMMSDEERMAASQKGYENGIKMMSAEERMAENEKGYENGIGMMSAEERMAASQKGYENGLGAARKKGTYKEGNAWEKKYAEFKSYDGMPERGTPLFNWQQHQLSNTHASCLNAKIQEEIEDNEGSTIWRERRVKLSDCVVEKNHAKIGNAWENKYAELKSYDGMPERGTPLPLHNWLRNQLTNTNVSCLNAKIQKELAENEGCVCVCN
jgi:hypothetical protein